MAIEPIDYDYITSTPDERAAIDQVNDILSQVEWLKSQGDERSSKLIAAFESWYGALKEKQSHWTVPAVLKSYRVSETDVSEAQRQLYAIKSAMGAITPEDNAPPNVIPPEEKPKDVIEEAEDAIKAGITLAAVIGGGYLLYRLVSK